MAVWTHRFSLVSSTGLTAFPVLHNHQPGQQRLGQPGQIVWEVVCPNNRYRYLSQRRSCLWGRGEEDKHVTVCTLRGSIQENLLQWHNTRPWSPEPGMQRCGHHKQLMSERCLVYLRNKKSHVANSSHPVQSPLQTSTESHHHE